MARGSMAGRRGTARRGAALLALVVLAACGGSGVDSGDPGGGGSGGSGGSGGGGTGGGGGSGGTTPPPSGMSYADTMAAKSAMEGEMSGMSRVSQADMPTTGQSVYRGYMSATLSGPPGQPLSGDMTIVATFDIDRVQGRIENIREGDETPYAGKLEIRPGTIDRTADPEAGPVFSAPYDGTLTSGIGAMDLAGTISGNFYGDGASHAAGPLSGTFTSRHGTVAMNGDFVLRK